MFPLRPVWTRFRAWARMEIGALLQAAGWVVQNYRSMNLSALAPDGAVPGVAVREFRRSAATGLWTTCCS